MCRQIPVAIVAVLAGGQLLAQPSEGATISFSGYYKNLLARSTTVLGGSERYVLDLNRLRLEAKGQLSSRVGMELQYDNEVLAGSYVHTEQAAIERNLPLRTHFDLQGVYASGTDYLARHAVKRASLTYSAGDTDFKVGRQRIAWGTGRFWSPVDLLNPFSPTALEPGEREGVDAFLVEHKRSAVSRASFVYAPPVRSGDKPAFLAQWHSNARGTDYSVSGGRHAGGSVLGIDAAGQIRAAGWRGEWTVTHPPSGRSFQRLLLGLDYAFPNTLTVSAELFYDGSGSTNPAAYDFAGLIGGRRQTVARRYAGLYASYEITPLLKSTNWAVVNLDDRSSYLSPRLSYSLRTNLDLTVGAQLLEGASATEFGRARNLYFASLQYFF